MGVYDTLIDGKIHAQVKCWDNLTCKSIMKGEGVPEWNGNHTYTICLPYGDGYALIVKGKFKGFTRTIDNVFPPFVTKWGEETDLNIDQDLESPIYKAVQALVKEFSSDE